MFGVCSEGEDVNAVFNAFEFLGKEDSDEDDEDDEEGEEVEESWSSDLSASPGVSCKLMLYSMVRLCMSIYLWPYVYTLEESGF